MKRFFVFLLALLLCAGLCLPIFAVPQNAMIHTATDAARNAVGKDTPGAAVAVFEGGTRTLFEGYGYADITARTLVTAQTSFEMGELSSLFVALAVQKLVEQGKVELDRDVAYYLPADFTKKLSLSHVITLRDLLTGGAGFAARKTDLRYGRDSLCFDTLADALLAEVPAQINSPAIYRVWNAFEIGLAALVVECVSGKPYEDFVGDEILLPLGMEHTILNPRAHSAIEMPAVGHSVTGEGVFATAEHGGRTFAALYPADGAISNLADLSLLLEFLLKDSVGASVLSPASRDAVCALSTKNGVFEVGAAGFLADGTARAARGATPHFSASFCLDRASGKGAVVLCNTTDSALLSLPEALCGFVRGARGLRDSKRWDAEILAGEYLPVSDERGNLAGREARNLHVSVDADGVMHFGDRRLVQVAPGLFAAADNPEGPVLVQFMLTVEGEVGEVYTADGICYRPASFFERDGTQTVLLLLLLIGSFYFLAAGALALADALLSRMRGERRPRAWRFTLPWMLAALHALFTLLQIWVGTVFANSAVTSFFTATTTMALLATVGACAGFVYALFTAFTARGMASRVVRSGGIYVLFLILSAYFGVIVF